MMSWCQVQQHKAEQLEDGDYRFRLMEIKGDISQRVEVGMGWASRIRGFLDSLGVVSSWDLSIVHRLFKKKTEGSL